jgi:DNA-binding NarL/FixJ family response regulator
VIRLLVVDDHPMVRTGLTQLLGGHDDIEVVGTASDGAEAVTAVAELAPHVVLMDLSMPGMDGCEATRRIATAHPDVRVVVLTSFVDREGILEALDAGAIGYLLKDAEPDELLRGVRAASVGESPLSPKAATAIVQARSSRSRAAGAEPELTPREREVLGLLTAGLANKQIARRLGISEKTVKAHLTSVFQRINVADRTQAALWAQRHDLVD